MLSSNSSLDISLLLKKRYAALAELLEPVAAQVDFPGDAAKASMILKKRDFKRWSVKFMSTNSSCQFLYSAVIWISPFSLV